MVMIALMKSPDHVHPPLVKAMVKGDEAVVELALRSSGEFDGQINPWKKIKPMYTNKMRYTTVLTPFSYDQPSIFEEKHSFRRTFGIDLLGSLVSPAASETISVPT